MIAANGCPPGTNAKILAAPVKNRQFQHHLRDE